MSAGRTIVAIIVCLLVVAVIGVVAWLLYARRRAQRLGVSLTLVPFQLTLDSYAQVRRRGEVTYAQLSLRLALSHIPAFQATGAAGIYRLIQPCIASLSPSSIRASANHYHFTFLVLSSHRLPSSQSFTSRRRSRLTVRHSRRLVAL